MRSNPKDTQSKNITTELAKNERDNERGATMVEYGVMVALILVMSMVAVTGIGTTTNEKFEELEYRLAQAAGN